MVKSLTNYTRKNERRSMVGRFRLLFSHDVVESLKRKSIMMVNTFKGMKGVSLSSTSTYSFTNILSLYEKYEDQPEDTGNLNESDLEGVDSVVSLISPSSISESSVLSGFS